LRIMISTIRKPDSSVAAPVAAVSEAPLSMLVPMIVLVAANLYFGVQTDLTVDTARGAADALFVVGEGAH
ncbi:MAG: hypothetical protein AAFR72_13865, partial [Pseudomonadota bacterium]